MRLCKSSIVKELEDAKATIATQSIQLANHNIDKETFSRDRNELSDRSNKLSDEIRILDKVVNKLQRQLDFCKQEKQQFVSAYHSTWLCIYKPTIIKESVAENETAADSINAVILKK